MANHRTPRRKAEIEARDLHDPGRYRNRPDHNLPPIGEPPEWLPQQAGEAWRAMASSIPWLDASHAALLEIAAILRVRVAAGTASIAEMSLLRQCLGSMGATPADASKLTPATTEDDPDEAFFRQPS